MIDRIFGDGCVLQRGENTYVFGKATPGRAVTVEFQGETYKTVSDGEWRVRFRNLVPGGPFELIADGEIIRDVLVGDVWLCAGQSNMELPMGRVKYYEPYELKKTDDLLRMFKVPENPQNAPQDRLTGGAWVGYNPDTAEDFSAAAYFFARRLRREQDVPVGIIVAAKGGTPIHSWLSAETCVGLPEQPLTIHDAPPPIDGDIGLREHWESPAYNDCRWERVTLDTPWDAQECGVVWFRKSIYIPSSWNKKPAKVYMGTIVDADDVYFDGEHIGSTGYRYPPRVYGIPEIRSGERLLAVRARTTAAGGEFTNGKARHIQCGGRSISLEGEWLRKRGESVIRHRAAADPCYYPSVLRNGMLYPLRGLNLSGAIWYQGESDTEYADIYAEKFRLLHFEMGQLFGQKNFPIVSVELAYYGEHGGWDRLRLAQREAAAVTRTALAAAADLGEYNDLHPQNKRQVGERLAQAALVLVYGREIESPYIFVL